MSTLRRRRRPAAASLAAAAALGVALTGCAAQQDDTQAALRSTEARLAQAEQRIQELEDRADRQVDLADLQAKAQGAMSGLDGAAQDAKAKADSLVGSLPAVGDVVDVQAVKDQGKVIVDYADKNLPKDPAALEQSLKDAAEKAKQSVSDLKKVEFRVGDKSFTF